MLRTAVSNDADMPWLRQKVRESLLPMAARLLPGSDGELRGELVGSMMIGILVLRYLVGIEPIASTPVDELVRRVAPALDALIGAAS